MDRYSIEEVGVGVSLSDNSRYVVYKNTKDVFYCKTLSEAVATLAVIRLTDKIFDEVLRPSYIGYEF